MFDGAPLIQITGAGFVNKGAALMLHAVVSHFDQMMPGANLAISPQVGSYRQRERGLRNDNH